MKPVDFIAAIKGAALECADKYRVPASVTIAQAALESSWGANAPGHNLFGIKADASWKGPITTFVTHEDVNGQRIQVTGKFRSYPDWMGSIDDHAYFLAANPRYEVAFEHSDGPTFASAIAAAGYATDPAYAQKLHEIMQAHDLCALDQPSANAAGGAV